MNRDKLVRLKARAQQVWYDLDELQSHIQKQEEWQRRELTEWMGRLADLLTFLINLERYLELNDEWDRKDSGTAEPDRRT